MRLLTFNVGSSSLRIVAFTRDDVGALTPLHSFHGTAVEAQKQLQIVSEYGPFDAVAHRIVHGGRYSLVTAALLNGPVIEEIRRVAPMAPDHNPAALKVIDKCATAFPGVAQYAAFDSAFHATLHERAWRYSIARDVCDQYGIRRFGFHGLSHAYSAEHVVRAVSSPRPLRHVSVHAGNGVSVTAILDGVSIDTTMGFTPLEGAMMGTRSGSIDPGVLFALQDAGMSLQSLRALVDGRSGLLGVSGSSGDYSELVARAQGDDACALAIDMYHHRLAGEIARMATALGGVDVLSFTGGVAEHNPVLVETLCARLKFLSVGTAFTIESREDEMLARAVASVVTPARAMA